MAFAGPVLTGSNYAQQPPAPEQRLANLKSNLFQVLNSSTSYCCSALVEVDHPSTCILFVGIRDPPSNARTEQRILIKCARSYPENDDYKVVEQYVLDVLNKVLPSRGYTYDNRYWIRVPKKLRFLPGAQIHEYLMDGVNLKSYILRHLRGTDALERQVLYNLGIALGN